MGLARFLPLVLVELAEVAPSSISMEFSVTAAGPAPADGEGPVGAAGEGPSSIAAHGSRTGSAGAGAPGRGGADTRAALADATLPRAGTGAARTGRAEGGRSGASGRGSPRARSIEAAARTGPA